jgi:predicted transcriptional regulator
MDLKKVVDKLGWTVAAGAGGLGHEVKGGYVSDLLSDVMANARAGALWITIQTHANLVAVCTLNELAGVVITGGKKPAEDTVAKAEAEGVPLLLAAEGSFDVAGKLHQLGVRGSGD